MAGGLDRWPRRPEGAVDAPGGVVARSLDLVVRSARRAMVAVPAFGHRNVMRQYYRLDHGDGEDRDRSDDWADR
jgi:hypothetical protein